MHGVVTQPILLLPVAMQLATVIGLFLFTAFLGITYVTAVANEGTAFFALVYALFFLFETVNPVAAMEPPAAFVSPEGLALAMQGARSIEFVGFALIVTLFILLVAAVTAYTRSMVIGVAANSVANKGTNIIELFRAARTHWLGTFKLLVPYALFLSIIIIASIPALILNIHYAVLSVKTPLSGWVLVRLIAIIFLAGYAAKTIFAEGVIAQGSSRPVRESIAYFLLHWQRGFQALILLIAAGASVLILDAARSYLNLIVPLWAAGVITLVFFALVALWRLWTTFFVVRLVR